MMEHELTRREAIKTMASVGVLAVAGAALAGPASMATTAPAATLMALDAFKDGRYVLPALPYAYEALEPVLDAQTLHLHHDKHHAGYVQGFNSTLDKLATAGKAGDFAAIKALSRDLSFHGSGHVLHTLFWRSMDPARVGKKEVPIPDLLSTSMKASFGSVESGLAQFAAAAKDVEGSGWGVLAMEPISRRLLVLQAEKHQDLSIWGVVPLLVCDVWEHAYYLKYQNRRADWVDAFMTVANWTFAAKVLSAAGGAD